MCAKMDIVAGGDAERFDGSPGHGRPIESRRRDHRTHDKASQMVDIDEAPHMVPRARIELATPRFSGACSTD
jgi:hypothetical protein